MDLSNEKHPSKPTQPVGGNREIESPKAELLSPRKPMKPMIHSQQIVSPKTESLCPECTKCVEFGAETEPQSFPVERIILQEVEFAKHVKKEEKRSKTKRRERRSKRKILGELNLGFDEKRACSWNYDVWEMNYEANACGYGKLRSPQHFVKMPPLNDGSAMKEHLKSWAYAVACTVR